MSAMTYRWDSQPKPGPSDLSAIPSRGFERSPREFERDSFDATLRAPVLRDSFSRTTPRRIMAPTLGSAHGGLGDYKSEGLAESNGRSSGVWQNEEWNAPRSSIGQGLFTRISAEEETPDGRMMSRKRGRPEDLTREEIETDLHEESRTSAAGRWILSKLARIPIVGALISPNKTTKDSPTAPADTGKQPRPLDSAVSLSEQSTLQQQHQSLPQQSLPQQSLSQQLSAERSPICALRLNDGEVPRIISPSCSSRPDEELVIRDENGLVRPLTRQERQIVADLPTYKSAEEEAADLAYILRVRKACTSLYLFISFFIDGEEFTILYRK